MIKMAGKQLTPDETAYFCGQLATMLNSGIHLNDGLDILAEDIGEARLKKVCTELSAALYDGGTLFYAMEKTGVFPEYAVSMVRIGTVTGRLEDVLNGLSEYYENRGNMQRTLRSAVLHPLMLLIMMTAVIIVLVVQVIPMFADIFSRFDSTVSETVSRTVDVAYGTGTVILIVLAAIIVIAVIAVLLSHSAGARKRLSAAASVIPGLRRLSRRFAQAKLANAMSVMVSSGISPEESLENALPLIDDKRLNGQIDDCRKRVLNGEYFADAVCESGMFPSIYGRSLKIAYTSGSFDTAWRKISDKCSEETERTAANLISFIEPAIIVILAAVIGSILLTVMIPLMNIMSVLG